MHPGKTKLMITRSGFIGPLPNVTMDGHTINFISKSTCLGMEVDNRLISKLLARNVAKN